MNTNKLQISIRDFRAIKRADIALNGITVLAGVNGSGKSTVSKLIYCIIKWMMDYNDLVLRNLESSLRKYFNILENLTLTYTYDFDTYKKLLDQFQLRSIQDLQDIESRCEAICHNIIEYKNNKDRKNLGDSERERKMVINTVEAPDYFSLEDALHKLMGIIHDQVTFALDKVKNRPSSILNDHLDRLFNDKVSKKITLFEYGEDIFSEKKTTVPIPHYVSQQFYIDTPYAIDNESYPYWRDLNNVLKQDNHKIDSEITTIINKIINGSARYEKNDSNSGFFFRDVRGNDFNLLIAATGIRSFSILQMLLKNGQISENSLLILDEPEAHLHPQWIVEYARLIIVIHKTIGAKFIISSHNPDMISAIRYIADAENCSSQLEFYTARQAQDGTGRYNFRSTGLDIEPIFKSFNKSYDRLNKYAEDYDKE